PPLRLRQRGRDRSWERLRDPLRPQLAPAGACRRPGPRRAAGGQGRVDRALDGGACAFRGVGAWAGGEPAEVPGVEARLNPVEPTHGRLSTASGPTSRPWVGSTVTRGH